MSDNENDDDKLGFSYQDLERAHIAKLGGDINLSDRSQIIHLSRSEIFEGLLRNAFNQFKNLEDTKQNIEFKLGNEHEQDIIEKLPRFPELGSKNPYCFLLGYISCNLSVEETMLEKTRYVINNYLGISISSILQDQGIEPPDIVRYTR